MLRTNCVTVHGKLLSCEPRYTETDEPVLYGYRLKILVDVTPDCTDEVPVFVPSQIKLPGYIKDNTSFNNDIIIRVFGMVTGFGVVSNYIEPVFNE